MASSASSAADPTHNGKPNAAAKQDEDGEESLVAPKSKASLVVAYILWLTTGWMGGHLFYLGRYYQGTVWLQTCGAGILGWLRDAFVLPRYVAEANQEPAHVAVYKAQRRHFQRVPPLDFWRISLEASMAGFYYVVVTSVAPSLPPAMSTILGGLAAGLGVWLVGNIGHETGSLKRTLQAAGVAAIVCVLTGGGSTFVPVIATFAFNRSRRFSHSSTRRPYGCCNNGCGRMSTVCGLQVVFIIFVIFALANSDSKVDVSFGDADTGSDGSSQQGDSSGSGDGSGGGGDAGSREGWGEWYSKFQQQGGWSRLWNEIVDNLQTEEDPYVVLQVPSTATWPEIKSAYHKLAVKVHPDKNPDDPKAQAKFMRVQEAYEKLRKKHNGGGGGDSSSGSSWYSSGGEDGSGGGGDEASKSRAQQRRERQEAAKAKASRSRSGSSGSRSSKRKKKPSRKSEL